MNSLAKMYMIFSSQFKHKFSFKHVHHEENLKILPHDERYQLVKKGGRKIRKYWGT